MYKSIASSGMRYVQYDPGSVESQHSMEDVTDSLIDVDQVDGVLEAPESYDYVNVKDVQPDFVQVVEKRPYRMRNRTPAMTHFCPTCNKELKYPSKINEHMRKHTGERPYVCHICGSRFSQGHVLKVHLRTHQGQRPFKCAFCERCFTSVGQKNSHEKTHFRGNNVVCTDPSLMCAEDISHHVYLCPFEGCGLQSPNREEVEDHIAVVHANDQVWTEEYGIGDEFDGRPAEETDLNGGQYQFFEYEDMQMAQDIGVVLEEDDGKSASDVFDNFTFVEDNVPPPTEEVEVETSGRSHINTHMLRDVKKEDPVVVVDDFGNDYALPSSSSQNFDEIPMDDLLYEEERVRVWLDPQPPKKGRQVQTLEEENETMEEVVLDARVLDMAAPKKPYGQKTRMRKANKPARNLDWIIDAVAKGHDVDLSSPHNRKKPKIHVCEFCGKVDKYPSKILAHMRTHTGEKPFKCEICGMAFAQRTPMRLHVRRHLNHKPYACTFVGCNEEFVSGALLNLHLAKKHFKQKKYVCLKGCGRYFASARNQHNHELRCFYDRDAVNGIDDVVYQHMTYDEQTEADCEYESQLPPVQMGGQVEGDRMMEAENGHEFLEGQ